MPNIDKLGNNTLAKSLQKQTNYYSNNTGQDEQQIKNQVRRLTKQEELAAENKMGSKIKNGATKTPEHFNDRNNENSSTP